MMIRQSSLAPIALSLLLHACGGGGGGTPTPDARPGSGADAGPIGGAGTINGVVSDIGTGARVSGATVSGGGRSTTTDASGQFTLTGLAAGNVSVSITKTGYAPGFANG